MGFGILLIGYALAFGFTLSTTAVGSEGAVVNSIPYFFADIIGGLLMAYAFSKLSAYNKKFRFPLVSAAFFVVFSIIAAVGRFVVLSSSDLVSKMIEALVACSIIILHFTLFYSIIDISREVGLQKITMKARRNMIIMILYFTLYTVVLLMHKWLELNHPSVSNYLYLFLTVFQLLWLFINLILIGSCLKRIGPSDEAAVDPSPSKIKKFYAVWSEKENRIFTPKEKRPDSSNTVNKKK